MRGRPTSKPILFAVLGTALLTAILVPGLVLAFTSGAEPDQPAETKQQQPALAPDADVQQPALTGSDGGAPPEVSQEAAPEIEAQAAADLAVGPGGEEQAEPPTQAAGAAQAGTTGVSPSDVHSDELPELPPDYVQDRGELPPGVTEMGGCFLPPDAVEITSEEAVDRGQRVFDSLSERFYFRSDGSCIAGVLKGPGSELPDYAPDSLVNPNPVDLRSR